MELAAGTGDAPDDSSRDTSDGSGTDTGEPATGTDSGSTTYTAPEATWSPETVQTELNGLLSLGVPDPFTIFEAWQSMFAGADPACPGGGEYNITSTALGCVSEAGWTYAGQSSYQQFFTEVERSTVLSSDGYIISPDAGTMIGGGTVAVSLIEDGPVQAWWIELEGIFGLDSSPSPWLSQNPSMAMYFGGGLEDDTRQAGLVGGWSVDGRAVYMDLEIESGCEGATGTIQMRDPSGAWHVLSLECGSCGSLSYADHGVQGEICVDLTPVDAFLDLLEAAL